MDPLTQGMLGAIGAQNLGHLATNPPTKYKQLKLAGILGFLAGLSADLDVLIKSESDPLLAFEYHRQFTHSLIFIPFGGLLSAVILFSLFSRRWKLSFQTTMLYCTAGYATHALLDACTTYGTQLFWPFSNVRIAWNTVSIIDPLFTLPLLALVIAASFRNSTTIARIALAWVFIYLAFGMLQRDRAEEAAYALANERGHQAERLIAMPSIGNAIVWKTVYQADNKYYVDVVRTGISISRYEGRPVEKYSADRHFPWLNSASQQATDIQRFRWFTNDYIGIHPDDAGRIIDVRYSRNPLSVDSMWSVQPAENKSDREYIKYVASRSDVDSDLGALWSMYKGQ
jgi:inner membrane protein